MSDDFESEMEGAGLEIEGLVDALHLGIVAAVHESITVGSATTAAPGQPVQSGNLKNSYQPEPIAPGVTRVSSNVVYAEPIEEGVGAHGPLTLRSVVGGFHSVKMTIAGFPRLVEKVVSELEGG